ncbi:MAG: beta-1,6-N-acetylglucosaminyltransferase [Capsulimonadaceae bacterium]|nr:beta-1,6-N-acetylglucosaminyltransferase [Capsulimonadaceae bacterium]
MLAYSILLHTDIPQFEVLFRNIYDAENIYAIHLDADASHSDRKRVEDFVHPYHNVHLVPPLRCIWAGWSLVAAELRAIRLLTSIDPSWRFYVNLSGQDMPLASQATIRRTLSAHDGSNFIEIADPTTHFWVPKRYEFLYVEQFLFGKSQIRIPRYHRPFLKGVRWYSGSHFKILSRDFCDFLADKKNIAKYENFFRFSHMADEQFYQTVIMDTEFAHTVINDNKRYLLHADNTAHPKWLTIEDFDVLRDSKKLYARKFATGISSELIRRIESDLLNKQGDEPVASNAQSVAPPSALQGTRVLDSAL